ncbi:MAG: DUF4856 domain-containing protein, partial [Myxococcales bacterium]|nr:DUF4856 domain-containing protein [Myxococcales bacterium]
MRRVILFSLGMALFAGCDDSGTSVGNNDGGGDVDGGPMGDGGGGGGTGPTYAFESRFVAGENSVGYAGQTARHVLIQDLIAEIEAMTEAIDSAKFEPTADGDVVERLDYYFRFDGDSNGGDNIRLGTDPATAQKTYDDISTGKDLVGKIAGNDTATDHKDWSKDFAGWTDTSIADSGGSIATPEGLVTAFFETLEKIAIDRQNGTILKDPDNNPLPVHVTTTGLDLAELTEKFLLSAIAFHQGADDYLDDDVEGKGILSDNVDPADEGANYTALEHGWDEAFGYFGAAANYDEYTDEELAAKGGRDDWQGYHDTDGDSAIDLTSEFNFGASTNAAKRDLGAKVATDLTKDAFTAFVAGRTLITEAGGELSEAQLAELKGHRDAAVAAWEAAIAATAVHYINEVLATMETFGTDDYDFAGHAKAWSELKGFALGFQFNPRSPVSDTDFVMLHTLIGDAPV